MLVGSAAHVRAKAQHWVHLPKVYHAGSRDFTVQRRDAFLIYLESGASPRRLGPAAHANM